MKACLLLPNPTTEEDLKENDLSDNKWKECNKQSQYYPLPPQDQNTKELKDGDIRTSDQGSLEAQGGLVETGW